MARVKQLSQVHRRPHISLIFSILSSKFSIIIGMSNYIFWIIHTPIYRDKLRNLVESSFKESTDSLKLFFLHLKQSGSKNWERGAFQSNTFLHRNSNADPFRNQILLESNAVWFMILKKIVLTVFCFLSTLLLGNEQ